MTDIEQKALALLNEVACDNTQYSHINRRHHAQEALMRAIEQHEAFRQEVSDVVKAYKEDQPHIWKQSASGYFSRFIITEPDPLVDALDSLGLRKADEWAGDIRKALAARGLEIRSKE